MPEVVAKLNNQMWPFAALLVGSCFLQVFLFVRNVLSFNKKAKLLSQEETIFQKLLLESVFLP